MISCFRISQFLLTWQPSQLPTVVDLIRHRAEVEEPHHLVEAVLKSARSLAVEVHLKNAVEDIPKVIISLIYTFAHHSSRND